MKSSETIKFANFHVKSLYWLLSSPLLLTNQAFEQRDRLFPDELRDEWLACHEAWFEEQDAVPVFVEQYMRDLSVHQPIGVYAERLLAYYFTHAPGFTLHIYNHQVIHEGQTVTEIDFCVEWRQRLIHIELSVKFFLRTSNDEWVGPNTADTLSAKWDKVLNLQLPAAHQYLVSCFSREIESYFFLKGYLFLNESGANQWMKLSRFLALEWEGARFAFLQKKDWFSSFYSYNGKTQPVFKAKKFAASHFSISDHSLALVVLTRTGQQNVFIVKDDWGKSICAKPKLLRNPVF